MTDETVLRLLLKHRYHARFVQVSEIAEISRPIRNESVRFRCLCIHTTDGFTNTPHGISLVELLVVLASYRQETFLTVIRTMSVQYQHALIGYSH